MSGKCHDSQCSHNTNAHQAKKIIHPRPTLAPVVCTLKKTEKKKLLTRSLPRRQQHLIHRSPASHAHQSRHQLAGEGGAA